MVFLLLFIYKNLFNCLKYLGLRKIHSKLTAFILLLFLYVRFFLSFEKDVLFSRYRERLKMKYPSRMDTKNWKFVKDGLDDFRDGLPPSHDNIMLEVKLLFVYLFVSYVI